MDDDKGPLTIDLLSAYVNGTDWCLHCMSFENLVRSIRLQTNETGCPIYLIFLCHKPPLLSRTIEKTHQ